VTRTLEIFFQRIAQKVAKSKKAKIFTTKLNLKVHNIYIKTLLKPGIPTTNNVLKMLVYVKLLLICLNKK
jgi:long-subunit acyl-CoA synthetase (AMP-forming)